MNDRSKGLVALALVAVLAAFEALVVRSIWNWHVVPVFHVRTLNFGHALGLVCLVAAVKYSGPAQRTDASAAWARLGWGFVNGVVLFALLWLLAWLGLQVGTKG